MWLLVTGGLLILGIAGLRFASQRRMPPNAPLITFGQVPEFSLTSEQNQPFSRSDLSGKVWVADFVFTSCAGPCPIMARRMADLQEALSGTNDLRLVSFTVDPERDTPEVLRAYGQRFGAQADRWTFLTGDRRTIYELSIHGFKLGVGEDPADESLILHSTKFVLVDGQYRIRGYYDGTDAKDVARLITDVRRLLAAGGS